MSQRHTKHHGIFLFDEVVFSSDEESDSASQDGDDYSSSQEGRCIVFVSPRGSSFSDDVQSKDLYQFFRSKFGRRQIKYANVVRNRRSKKTRGYGRVKFASNSVARDAIARFNGCLFLGKYRLYIGFVREPETKEVAFQCTAEHLLYLSYSFFEARGLSQKVSSLKQALPAKVISKNSKIYLLGTTQEVESSCEVLDHFLSGLGYRKVSYKYDCNHMRILEESFIPAIMKNEITCVLKAETPADLMHVHIFSHNTESLTSALRKFQVNCSFCSVKSNDFYTA